MSTYKRDHLESLLSAEHKRRIGAPGLWYFALLLSWANPSTGLVLHGRRVKSDDLAGQLGDCPNTALRVLHRLASAGLITLDRKRDGFLVHIVVAQRPAS